MKKNYILDEQMADARLRRMALEIVEHNDTGDEIILAGILDNGYAIAAVLKEYISQFSQIKTDLISISLDKRRPAEITLDRKMDFNDKVIILVDDVANSGRTILYSLKPFLDFHPRKIRTAILVSRSHNHFPIHTDYVGLPVSTTLQEHIFVEVEKGRVVGAYLE